MAQSEYGNDILTLVDEDGQEHEFEVVDTLEMGEERYMALVASYDDPQETLEDDGELVILKVLEDEDGEDYLEAIQEEEEFDQVAAIFMERLEDDFDFNEEDE